MDWIKLSGTHDEGGEKERTRKMGSLRCLLFQQQWKHESKQQKQKQRVKLPDGRFL